MSNLLTDLADNFRKLGIRYYTIGKAKATELWTWFRAQPKHKQLLWAAGVPVAAVFALICLLTLLVLAGALGALPNKSELGNIRNDQASVVYSSDGAILGKYYLENRIDVAPEDIAPFVSQALVATEDSRFFEHSGIDLRAWGRVLVKSVLLQDDSAGGGSTLSQQLAKNVYKRKDYFLFGLIINKIRETIIARRLEKVYDKPTLLNLYLNTVPFGDNAFGIQVASQRFFSKPAAKLTVEEASVLVGMLKGNSIYNPRLHPEAATERRNVVLTLMQRQGHLDNTALDSLKALPITLNYKPEGHNEGLATYFREHLRQEVLDLLKEYEKPDGSPYNLYTDGLRIYTTIDSRMQRYAEEAVAKNMPQVQANFNADWAKRQPWTDEQFKSALRQTPRFRAAKEAGQRENRILEDFEKPINMTIFTWKDGAVDTLMSPMDSLKYYLCLMNVGLLSVDPQEGLVRAWVGGINNKFVQFDHVKSRRPVGSTFKPIVYTAALQSGMMPCEYTADSLMTYEKGYTPTNSDGEYGGVYSMAGALAKSVNTVAVALANRAGISQVRALAAAMGIEGKIPSGSAIALGAVDASLLEMVKVYSTFANRGYRPTRFHYLDRIETADGEILYKGTRPQRSQYTKVMEPGHADMMLAIMQTVVDSGTARSLRRVYGISGPLMGKTGTTQEQADGWFIGFGPKLVTGVWVGADNPAIRFRSLSRGQAAKTALPVFGSYTASVYRNFKAIRTAGYPAVPEEVTALLDCPPFLEELPLFWEADEPADEMALWEQVVNETPPANLEIIVREYPRDQGESLGQYAQRVQRINASMERKDERQERREERQEKRQEILDKILGGG